MRRTAFQNTLYEERKKEGGIEVTERRERRRKQLLDAIKATSAYSKLKEDALDRNPQTIRFRKDYRLLNE